MMKLFKHDGKTFDVSIYPRVTGSLKDSVARELSNLKDDPKDLKQKDILSKIQSVLDANKKIDAPKVNLADGMELNLIAKKPYSESEYNVIRENDAVFIRVFKLIVDKDKINAEDLDLFNTSELDAFWQNQDIIEVKENVEFFRKKAAI